MEWEFTAQEVVRGETDYGLMEFRRDLGVELDMNLPARSAVERDRTFRLAYDLCHWMATERAFDDFLQGIAGDPEAMRLAHALRAPMRPNVEMLGAILQRMINEAIARGMTVEAAVAHVGKVHAEAARARPEQGHDA